MCRPWIGQYMTTADVMWNYRHWGWVGLHQWLKPHVAVLTDYQLAKLDTLRNVERFVFLIDAKRYYDSDYWKELREHMLTNAICVVCGTIDDLQLHHLHYNAIYRETGESVVPLCKKCHILVHPFNSWGDYIEGKKKKEYALDGHIERCTRTDNPLYDITVAGILAEQQQGKKRTLYVLIEYGWDGAFFIHGVFSSQKKAEDAKKQLPELFPTNLKDVRIEPIELDELGGGYQICP